MKTFTAEELNKSPAQVYREADKNGSVQISHDRYPGMIFVMKCEKIDAWGSLHGHCYIKTEDGFVKIIEELNGDHKP